jgi:hypothetical protein
VPQTIIKDIRDINDRLRAVAEASGVYEGERRERELSEMSKEQVAKLVAQMEAEMRAAARELEFERAAALRDEIQRSACACWRRTRRCAWPSGGAGGGRGRAATGARRWGAARRRPPPSRQSGRRRGGQGSGVVGGRFARGRCPAWR